MTEALQLKLKYQENEVTQQVSASLSDGLLTYRVKSRCTQEHICDSSCHNGVTENSRHLSVEKLDQICDEIKRVDFFCMKDDATHAPEPTMPTMYPPTTASLDIRLQDSHRTMFGSGTNYRVKAKSLFPASLHPLIALIQQQAFE